MSVLQGLATIMYAIAVVCLLAFVLAPASAFLYTGIAYGALGTAIAIAANIMERHKS